MIRYIQSMGPSGPIMVVISIVIIVLSITKAVHVYGRRTTERVKLERGVDAILFWGVFCAILGLHGQTLGMFKGFNTIALSGVNDPSNVFLGLAECLSSTVMGLTILMLSALIWFSLRTAVRRLLNKVS